MPCPAWWITGAGFLFILSPLELSPLETLGPLLELRLASMPLPYQSDHDHEHLYHTPTHSGG